MGVEIPAWATPVLWFYGLAHHWPNVNEDAVLALGDLYEAYFDALSLAIDESVLVLDYLKNETETEVFSTLHEAIEGKKKDVVDPFVTGAKLGIDSVTTGYATAISAQKATILGILATNIASDIPIIVSGVGIAFILPKKAATRVMLDMLLEPAKAEVLELVMNHGQRVVGDLLLDPQKKEWTQDLSAKLTRVLSVQVSGPGGGGGSGAPKLRKDQLALLQSGAKMTKAMHGFLATNNSYKQAAADNTDVTENVIAGSDSMIAMALKDMAMWIWDQVTGIGIAVLQATVDSLIEIIFSSGEKLDEAEKKAHANLLALQLQLAESRPLSTPSTTAAPPNFFAPIQVALGVGTAREDADDPAQLREPVGGTKPVGMARVNPTDMSVLDVEVDETKGTGRADNHAGDGQQAVDATVTPV